MAETKRHKLTIDGKPYEVKSFSYNLLQHINPDTNETTSQVYGGTLDVSVEVRKADTHIVELMLLAHKDDIKGTLEFFNNKGENMRKIDFTDASVVSFSESINNDSFGTQSFTICARTLDIDGKKLELKRE